LHLGVIGHVDIHQRIVHDDKQTLKNIAPKMLHLRLSK